MPNYYCSICDTVEYNEAETPFNTEDGKDLCDKCYADREVKCDGCVKKVHHEEIELNEKNEKYCQRCVLITE